MGAPGAGMRGTLDAASTHQVVDAMGLVADDYLADMGCADGR